MELYSEDMFDFKRNCQPFSSVVLRTDGALAPFRCSPVPGRLGCFQSEPSQWAYGAASLCLHTKLLQYNQLCPLYHTLRPHDPLIL